MFIINLQVRPSINVFQFIDSTSAGYSVSPTVTGRSLSVLQRLAFSELEKQATYMSLFQGWRAQTRSCSWAGLGGSEGNSGRALGGAAGVWRVPSGCEKPARVRVQRRRRALRPEESTGRGMGMTPVSFILPGDGSAAGRVASGSRCRRSLCWGEKTGTAAVEGAGALLRWNR